MKYSVRWVLILGAAAVIPACGGGTGGTASSPSEKTRPVATGVPDLMFGQTGAVVRNASPASDFAGAVVSDGTYFYVAGTAAVALLDTAGQIEKRYLVNGMIEGNFGLGGVVTMDVSAGQDFYRAIALEGDNLYVVGGDQMALEPGDGQWRIEKRNKTTGELVPGFGNQGVVQINSSPTGDYACHVAVKGGWLYVAGRHNGNSSRAIRLDLVTGAKDVNWGDGLSDDGVHPLAFAIDDARVYLGVTFGPDPNRAWSIYSISLADNTAAWLPVFDPGPGADVLGAMAAKDGHLYMAGTDTSLGATRWQVRKLHVDTMTLDPAFGVGGVVSIDPTPGDDFVTGLAIDGAHLYILGTDAGGEAGRTRIEKRLLSTGAADPYFAAVSDPSPLPDFATSLCVIDGWILSAGYENTLPDAQWRVEKRSAATGALDATFGAPGMVARDADPTRLENARIVVAHDGFLYVAGTDRVPGADDSRWRIEKRSAVTGVPDGTFGNFGHLFIDPGTGLDEPTAMVLDGPWLYIGGVEWDGTTSKWRIEKRSIVDGAPDPAFGAGGAKSWQYSNGGDRLYALLVAGGYLFAAGADGEPGNGQWRIAKFELTTGQPVVGFGTKGSVTINPGPSSDSARFLCWYNQSLFVGGIDADYGDWRWRVEKLNKDTGAPVGGFIPILSNPSPMNDYFESMAVVDGAIYMTGMRGEPNVDSTTWIIEKHTTTNGKLVGSFGTGGQVLLNQGVQTYFHPKSIVVDSGFLYVGGSAGTEIDNIWRLEKRKATNGALVDAFGTGGVASSNHIILGLSTIYGLAVDDTHVYSVGVWQGEARIEKRTR